MLKQMEQQVASQLEKAFINTGEILSCRPFPPLLSPHSNAFSPCFCSFLFGSVAVVTGLTGIFQLINFIFFKPTHGPLWSERSHQSFKVFLILIQAVLFATCFISIISEWYSFQAVNYLAFLFHMLFIILPLHILESSKTHIQAATLLFYWPFQALLFLIVSIQQIFGTMEQKIIPNSSEFEVVCLALMLLNNWLIYYMEFNFYKPNDELIYYYQDNHLDLSEPNFISRITFSWMNRLIQTAHKHNGLEQDDLPPPPEIVSTIHATPVLEKHWTDELKKMNGKPSLLMALVRTFGFAVLISLCYDMADSIVSFVQPQLLKLLIKFFNSQEENPPIVIGFSIALGMFVISLFETVFYNQYFIKTVEAALGAKAALMQLIYKKAMRLSPNEKMDRSTGDIINHMSVDITRIQSLTSYVQTMVSAPTRLVLCLLSLYSLLGNSTWIGILTMAIMMPLNTLLVKSLRKYHKEQMNLKDKRTSFVSEILQNVKSIKLYAWEEPMLQKLSEVRNDQELKNLNKIGILSAGINFAWTCVPFFVSCSTFAVFAMFSGIPLTPEIVFPALSLFDLLSDPIFAIPALITAMIECSVSLNRLVSFLNADEIDTGIVKRLPKATKTNETTVEVSNCTFLWSKQRSSNDENYDEEAEIDEHKTVALRNINFQAKKGQLACIIGRVGSGKSTFLQCILGEMPVTPADRVGKADISIHGSIAYCSQVPWIINTTFKENILFGHKFDKEFYERTIDVCQLTPDLEILPDGDQTLVGEKGISLSGGQKARLSLARAIYARADVYLLDDVLSAVDAHVGQKLIENVLGKNGILKTKTRILATNSIKVLNQASKIFLLEDNGISESGRFNIIMKSKSGKLFQLIEEYGKEGYDNVSVKSNEPDSYSSSSSSVSVDSSESFSGDDVIEGGELEGIKPLGVAVDDTTGNELSRFENKLERQKSHTTLRRASASSFKRIAVVDGITRKTAHQEEKKEKGKVKWSVFKAYAKACSYTGISITLGLVVLTVGLSIASNYWLMYWSERNDKEGSNKDVLMYVGIYALLGIGSGFLTLLRAMAMWTLCSIRASKKMHSEMAKAILGSPLSFFETTPLGRIMNRFSQDMSKVDSALPRVFSGLFSSCVKTLFTMVIIGYNMPLFLVIIIFLSVIYHYYQQYYVTTVRDLKRIVSISKSPIFAHIQESLTGCETIRAYSQDTRFSYLNAANIDLNQVSAYCLKSVNRWLSTRLQFIGSIIIFSTSSLALFSLSTKNPLSAGLLGLIMSYALRVTSSLSFIVRRSVEIESDVVCCERIFEYCSLPPECDEEAVKDKLLTPPLNWPHEGTVKFDHYSTRYREQLDPILKDISISVSAKEKIGIVGRTGAGKSSLVLSIFRIIEPISGHIEIDTINTSDLRLSDVRKNLSIIPQDAQCIEGTIRYNLDPFNEYSDDQIWKAIRMSKLEDQVNKMAADQETAQTLNSKISESGLNLSVGQRQLFCLARVLLKSQQSKNLDLQPSKILILDEATSSVDAETDRIIQETIRSEFSHLTILTIAHRLDTIMDSDRILVLDKGEVAEFDSPNSLLKNSESMFYKLCEDGGLIQKKF